MRDDKASSYRSHVERFVSLDSAADLMRDRVYPNAKEITEAISALHAVETYVRPLGFSTSRRSVTVVCVGDGSTPRCGALFAAVTPWRVVSVDPALRVKSYRFRGEDRLEIRQEKIEDTAAIEADRAVIVAIHSHAPIRAAIDKVKARSVAVVAMPCCVPHNLPRLPDVQYEDDGVWSPERTMRVWLPRRLA